MKQLIEKKHFEYWWKCPVIATWLICLTSHVDRRLNPLRVESFTQFRWDATASNGGYHEIIEYEVRFRWRGLSRKSIRPICFLLLQVHICRHLNALCRMIWVTYRRQWKWYDSTAGGYSQCSQLVNTAASEMLPLCQTPRCRSPHQFPDRNYAPHRMRNKIYII